MFFSSDADTISTREGATLAKPFFAITLDEYSGLFVPKKPGAKLLGEASTAYLANPKRSAQLMKKIVPEVKIIAILREPAERAVSAYKMCVGKNIEQRSFAEIVGNAQNEREILPSHGVKEYIRNGLYSQLLAPYYKYFSAEQILLLDYEQLKQAPKAFMYEIFHFLQVEPIDNDFEKKYNTESDHVATTLPVEKEDVKKLKDFYREENLKLKFLGNEDDRDKILQHIQGLVESKDMQNNWSANLNKSDASRIAPHSRSVVHPANLRQFVFRFFWFIQRMWARLQRIFK